MTFIKFIITFITSTFFLCCGQNSRDNSNTLNNRNDTIRPMSIDTLKTDRWKFRQYLNDSRTPQLAKDIFNNKWKLKDDEPLDFLENLHGQDIEARPFYFRVVTNSYKQADGAFAEGLGNAGYEYVMNYPGEFSNYFVGQEAFSDADLRTWAEIVLLEFQIISENEYERTLVKSFADDLAKKCKDCSSEQKEVLKKFSRYLQEK